MPQQPIKREFAFTIMDVARLLKTYADQRARQFGISRAQWAVLIRIDRSEGLKQSELADMLDLQPITLTRLLDRLADNGLIERRADPNDRRANRLYLKPAATTSYPEGPPAKRLQASAVMPCNESTFTRSCSAWSRVMTMPPSQVAMFLVG